MYKIIGIISGLIVVVIILLLIIFTPKFDNLSAKEIITISVFGIGLSIFLIRWQYLDNQDNLKNNTSLNDKYFNILNKINININNINVNEIYIEIDRILLHLFPTDSSLKYSLTNRFHRLIEEGWELLLLKEDELILVINYTHYLLYLINSSNYVTKKEANHLYTLLRLNINEKTLTVILLYGIIRKNTTIYEIFKDNNVLINNNDNYDNYGILYNIYNDDDYYKLISNYINK